MSELIITGAAQQAANKIPITDNLLVYLDANYPGNIGNQWVRMDRSLAPYNGLLYNGASITNVGGINALYLDGVDDSMVIGSCLCENEFYRTNPPTFEFWFRSNGAFTGNGNLAHNGYNPNTRIRFSSIGNLEIIANGMTGGAFTGDPFAQDTWYHLVVTLDSGGDYRVYRNGVLIHSMTTGTYNPQYTASAIVLGEFTSFTEKGRFYINVFRYYNRSFTQSDVLKNFNVEKERFGY